MKKVEIVRITEHRHKELLDALSKLGVKSDGVCAREAVKLMYWHQKGMLDVVKLNILAGIDRDSHARLGLDSYRDTNTIDIKYEELL